MRLLPPVAVSLALAWPQAGRAESAAVNFHVEPGLAVSLQNRAPTGGTAAVKVDFAMLGLGPVAPQLEGLGVGLSDRLLLSGGSAVAAGLGIRLRLMDDKQGYLLHVGTEEGHKGNLFGNLWLDGSGILAAGGLGFGFDVGLGVELSLVDGLQLGPNVKYVQLGEARMLLAGLSLSVGAPDTTQQHDPDPDRDGILGAKDRCPEQAEDRDGFEDEDGCPDLDDDKDGIPDAKDRCRTEPEDKDGVEDEDGCPEDDDKDGIPDAKDGCRAQPEDKDGFQDEDGCPDPDNDQDLVPDGADRCPNDAEDKDGFEDEDGCPEPDNDKDGIVDGKDMCPNEAETFNGKDDEDGCPEKETKAFIQKQQIVITEKVFFEFNKARVLPKSDPVLRSVAEVMQKFPQIKKLRVEGHTDDVGTDEANQKLSERRAKAVLDRLVKFGLEAGRLESQGFGKSRPLVPGETEAAREQNRRVEFVIIDPPGGQVEILEQPPAPEAPKPDAGTP
ncbi:MAG: OmpA family protein [Myxococcales bacterium]|nr:OmpA family protein [Myxococcales bacterium]